MDVRGACICEHPSVRGTSDEKIFMTRTVCRTSALFLLLQSDQCITRYKDSKRDQDENMAFTLPDSTAVDTNAVEEAPVVSFEDVCGVYTL